MKNGLNGENIEKKLFIEFIYRQEARLIFTRNHIVSAVSIN